MQGKAWPLGRHVAWCARHARKIRHSRLRDFFVEYIRSTGAVATSEQAVPLPRDSQPAAREARAADGTDIWLDVEDRPRELSAWHTTPTLTLWNSSSQGDSLTHDFADWYSQDSQQDRFST